MKRRRKTHVILSVSEGSHTALGKAYGIATSPLAGLLAMTKGRFVILSVAKDQ